jgi:glutathione S-transferase
MVADSAGDRKRLVAPLGAEVVFPQVAALEEHDQVARIARIAAVNGEAPAAVRAAREGFAKQVQVADQALAQRGPFVLGALFTGADILLATCLGWAERLEVPLTATLRDYLARATARPAYRLAHLANQRS